PNDKRGVFANLTDEAYAALERAARDHVETVRTYFIDVIEPEGLEAIGRAFTLVLRRVGPAGWPSSPEPGRALQRREAGEETDGHQGQEAPGEHHAEAERPPPSPHLDDQKAAEAEREHEQGDELRHQARPAAHHQRRPHHHRVDEQERAEPGAERLDVAAEKGARAFHEDLGLVRRQARMRLCRGFDLHSVSHREDLVFEAWEVPLLRFSHPAPLGPEAAGRHARRTDEVHGPSVPACIRRARLQTHRSGWGAAHTRPAPCHPGKMPGRWPVRSAVAAAALIAVTSVAAACGGGDDADEPTASVTPPTATETAPPSPSPTEQGFQADVKRVTREDLPHSWRRGCPVPPSGLRMIEMTYWGMDDRPHTGGRLVVNAKAAEDLVGVFRKLFDIRYPIERMEPVDKYRGSDFDSIEANNT